MGTIISFKLVDILATTGVWEDHILGGFPKEAPPYESLWLPFDSLTWILVLLSVIVVSLVLLFIEKIWSNMKRGDNFKTDGIYPSFCGYGSCFSSIFSALLITLSTLVEGNLPREWFNRRSFNARHILIFHWIIFSMVVTTVYL